MKPLTAVKLERSLWNAMPVVFWSSLCCFAIASAVPQSEKVTLLYTGTVLILLFAILLTIKVVVVLRKSREKSNNQGER